MQESKIYEIAQMIQNKATIENDLKEAKNIVKNMLHDKYINKMHLAIREKHKACCKNPTKEVHLLNAIKPFMHETSHHKIDKAIEMLTLMNTVKGIKSEVAPILYTQNVQEGIIHEDGVYEVDSNCIKGRENFNSHLLPIILLMLAQ